MKYSILIGLSIVVSFACNKKDNLPLMLTLINADVLYADGEENISAGNLIVENEQDWEDLLEKIDAVNSESENFTETEIDFETYWVIACFDKVRGASGYSITISALEETKNDVKLHVKRNSPDGINASVITQPYYLAKIPKTKKEIVFIE